MRFLSLFSGIEAASVAFEPIGGVPVAFSEIEPFPCAVLAHHYPNVPNLGDVTKITEGQIASLGPIDLVCFGSPCQDLSVAGKRKGLVDAATGDVTRSGLFFAAMRIFKWANKHCGARFALWENVAGAYSSNKGEDFAAVVAEMAGLENVRTPENGWGSEGCAVGDNGMLEWACMDAQWFGVAQRRRRVFAVLDTGDWANRPPLLLEPDSLRRDSPPSREAGEGTTGGSGIGIVGGFDYENNAHGANDPTGPLLKCSPTGGGRPLPAIVTAHSGCWWDGGQISQTLDAVLAKGQTMPEKNRFPAVLQPIAFPANLSGTQCAATENLSPSMGAKNPTAVACGAFFAGQGAKAGSIAYSEHISPTLKASDSGTNRTPTAYVAMQVRRLTPVECERLQGFPEIVKTCTITVFQHSNSNVCLSDMQSTNVLAAQKSHKSPSNASPAEESAYQFNAKSAAQDLNAAQGNSSEPVLVSAQIDLERQVLQLHSQEKLLLSVSTADESGWCRLPILAADFAQLSAELLTWLERTAHHGKAASRLNTSGSFPLLIGSLSAKQCGQEIEELASDAEKFTSAVKSSMKFITSGVGQNSPTFDLNLQTLLCCVSTAISSFIQDEIRAASSYALSIEVSHGYTMIPWRKKPASECPDGPRYKALGNSWAVPNVQWIGKRIAKELA